MTLSTTRGYRIYIHTLPRALVVVLLFSCVAHAQACGMGGGVTDSSEFVTKVSPNELLHRLGAIRRGSSRPKCIFPPIEAPDARAYRCSSGASVPAVDAVYVNDPIGQANLDIRFRPGSDLIDQSSHPLLINLAEALEHPDAPRTFAIVGHTDLQGNESEVGRRRNLELSCARAIAVRNFLGQQGVDTTRLATYGFGSNRPLEPNVVKSDINRRIEIRRAN